VPSPLIFWPAVDYEGTGRKLGTGLKVLGRMAKQRMDAAPPQSASSQSAARPAARPSAASQPQPSHAVPKPTAAPKPSRTAAAAREGGRRFGQAVWVPFSRAGHVLWLEITGLFFALFGIFFLSEAWKRRADWRMGPEHTHFLVYSAGTLVFAYFCVSSFVRARKRSKR
jgi:hypothetical protein